MLLFLKRCCVFLVTVKDIFRFEEYFIHHYQDDNLLCPRINFISISWNRCGCFSGLGGNARHTWVISVEVFIQLSFPFNLVRDLGKSLQFHNSVRVRGYDWWLYLFWTGFLLLSSSNDTVWEFSDCLSLPDIIIALERPVKYPVCGHVFFRKICSLWTSEHGYVYVTDGWSSRTVM